jgi:catechol 2,3-dioxygenase-like lactoylglutathione lyase family enzyme
MQIRHVIIKVDEQDKALSFYTSIVGFVKRFREEARPPHWSPSMADRKLGYGAIMVGPDQSKYRWRRASNPRRLPGRGIPKDGFPMH